MRSGDRVRHIDEQLFEKWGYLQVLEVKNGIAFCLAGGYNMQPITVSVDDLKMA